MATKEPAVSDDGTTDLLRLAREATDAAWALDRLDDLAAIVGEAPDALHGPAIEPRHRIAEAAQTLRGWAVRLHLEAGVTTDPRPMQSTVAVDREVSVEARRLVDRTNDAVHTGQGEPSPPEEFAVGVAALLHTVAAAGDAPSGG